MSIFQAFILGVVQGAAEFLPVSSSGHLAAVRYFFEQEDAPILFDILLHVSTLAAVCIVFRKKIAELCASLFRFAVRKVKDGDKENMYMIAALILATAVTVVLGFLLRDFVKTMSIKIIPLCFIITGLMLLLPSKFAFKKKLGLFSAAFFIGFAQGVGVLPGISRSGFTISAAQLAGFERSKAGEFSFLLSIPVIIGAFILELSSAPYLVLTVSPAALAIGMISSFTVGIFSLVFLLKLIKGGKLGFFSLYLIPLGIVLEIYFFFFA